MDDIKVLDSKESGTNISSLGQYTSFDNIIGHEIFVKILKKAIDNNTIHSFLFSGIRGIGKTSLARTLARSIICDNQNICGTCKACIDYIDIIEIDAATYTGVESIREIIEQSHFIPMISKNKVFIIDEAHMLSKSAFNALLKTIEEPNASSYFIFATTEINKIPQTIISRCLTCNLRPLNDNNIFKYMKQYIQDYKYSDDTIKILIKHAQGSIRDAKFILEKICLVCNNNTIEINDIRKVFGFVPDDIISIVRYIKSNNSEKAIEILNDISADPILILQEIADILVITDMNKKNKIYNYNIAINTLPLLKHYNKKDVIKIAIMKMCMNFDKVDELVEQAREYFPNLEEL